MYHLFDKDMAVKYGLEEAIIFNHLMFWIEKNEANEVNYYDGTYWAYNSVKALNAIFPYMSQKKISSALKNLKDAGLIKTGNYNKSPYDRTMWYAITEMGKSIYPKRKMEIPKKENGFTQNGEPIPDILTDILTDKKKEKEINKEKEAHSKSTTVIQTEFEELWRQYPRKLGKDKALAAYIKARKEQTPREAIEEGLKRYVNYIKANKIEDKYIKHGATWFNQKCWEDDYAISEYQAPDSAYDISNW